MQDLGLECSIRVWIDASAAKSVASRTGLGKIRHLETKFLWLQEAVSRKRLVIRKIRGEDNPADVLTKPLSVKEIAPKLLIVGGSVVGRSIADSSRVDGSSGVCHTARPEVCRPSGVSHTARSKGASIGSYS